MKNTIKTIRSLIKSKAKAKAKARKALDNRFSAVLARAERQMGYAKAEAKARAEEAYRAYMEREERLAQKARERAEAEATAKAEAIRKDFEQNRSKWNRRVKKQAKVETVNRYRIATAEKAIRDNVKHGRCRTSKKEYLIPIRHFAPTIPMQTCYMTTDPNGKKTVGRVENWNFTVPDEIEHDRWYYANALAVARSTVANEADVRTYFAITPTDPNHADLINAWADMAFGSFYRFSMRNDGRAEKVRKLDWAGREDVRSIAIVSLYTDHADNMHHALNNALNAIDRYLYGMRQSGAEYNPTFSKHNESTEARPDHLSFIPRRSAVDMAIAEAISNMTDDVNREIIELMMEGYSIRTIAELMERTYTTVARRRYRAIAEFLEKLEATDGIVYIFDKLGVDMTEWFCIIGEWTEKARKVKGKK